jgi:hypothetical protein
MHPADEAAYPPSEAQLQQPSEKMMLIIAHCP